MITSTDLELRTDLTPATLATNAKEIQKFVEERLADYNPDNYIGKAEEAKADRAILNAAEKTLNAKRLELERQYMLPFNEFKGIITDTCKAIKQASGQLDAIVKAEEEREKAAKRKAIEDYWISSKFTLYDIDKVFDPRWLNKGTKLKDVYEAIDELQSRTFNDLKIIEKFPAEDVPLIKTNYLNTLDINQAMQEAERLKENRERLAQAKIQEAELQRRRELHEQEKAEIKEAKELQDAETASDLASQALGLEIKEAEQEAIGSCALLFKGTEVQLLKLKALMTDIGITYTKLKDKGNGVYTAD